MKLTIALRRISAVIGIAALLFMQQAAASMLSCERARLMTAGAAMMDDPCPMSGDASAPLCAQKCDPDNNKGQTVDVAILTTSSQDFDFSAFVPDGGGPKRHTPPDLEHQTGPPLYLAYLRMLLP